jgi:hypothetical protein
MGRCRSKEKKGEGRNLSGLIDCIQLRSRSRPSKLVGSGAGLGVMQARGLLPSHACISSLEPSLHERTNSLVQNTNYFRTPR